jgi:hypothetical protein
MKYLKSYNESIDREITTSDVERVLDLELEQYTEFSIVEYGIDPLNNSEKRKLEEAGIIPFDQRPHTLFYVNITFSLEDNTELSTRFDEIQGNLDCDLKSNLITTLTNDIGNVIKPILQKLSKKYEFEIESGHDLLLLNNGNSDVKQFFIEFVMIIKNTELFK